MPSRGSLPMLDNGWRTVLRTASTLESEESDSSTIPHADEGWRRSSNSGCDRLPATNGTAIPPMARRPLSVRRRRAISPTDGDLRAIRASGHLDTLLLHGRGLSREGDLKLGDAR